MGAKESGKKKICNALLAILERKNLDDISVKELIAEAGVNRSTYNYHFYSIQNVFESVLDDFNEGLINYFESLSQEVETNKMLELNVAQKCFQYLLDNKKTVLIIDKAGYGQALISRFEKSMESFFHGYEMTFDNDKGEEFTVSNGLLYELTIKEYCFTVGADLQLWMEYNFLLPIDEIIESALSIKRMHLKRCKLLR